VIKPNISTRHMRN